MLVSASQKMVPKKCQRGRERERQREREREREREGERESLQLAGLQHIGGYILRKLHNNFRNHKNWRDIELQQATSLIGACSTTKPCENKKLNSVMSRRGL